MPADFPTLRQKLEGLLELNENSDFQTEINSARLIVDILSILLQDITESREEKYPGRLKMTEVKKYLDEHYTEKFSLDELSERFFISKYHLSREFHQYYGTTLNQYVISRRLTRAKKLLRFSVLTLDEIARSSVSMTPAIVANLKTPRELPPRSFEKNGKINISCMILFISQHMGYGVIRIFRVNPVVTRLDYGSIVQTRNGAERGYGTGIAHAEGVLTHDAGQCAVLHSLHQPGRGVKACGHDGLSFRRELRHHGGKHTGHIIIGSESMPSVPGVLP